MKFVAVLLALAAVVAALLYPFSVSERRQAFPALPRPGAAAGLPAQPSSCPAPLYLRMRNISSLDFYELEVDGFDFGPLPAGAQTGYRPASDCVYRVAAIAITSSQGHATTVPYDLLGEDPIEAGYYTRALNVAPNNDVTSQLTRDAAPNESPADSGATPR